MSEIKAAKVISAARAEIEAQQRRGCNEAGPQAVRNLMIRLGLYAAFCATVDGREVQK